jgi:hypothetical protein
MPLRDTSAGMHHVTATPASITYNTRLPSQSMRWTRLLVVHDVIQLVQSCWLIEAVPHRGGSIIDVPRGQSEKRRGALFNEDDATRRWISPERVVSQFALPLPDLKSHNAANYHSVTSRAAAHCNSASSSGHSACPPSIKPYSTFGGTCCAQPAAQSRPSPAGEAAGSTSSGRSRGSPVPARKSAASVHQTGGRGSGASISLPET